MKLQAVINVEYTQLASLVVIVGRKRYSYSNGRSDCWMRSSPRAMLKYLSAKGSSPITYAVACKVKLNPRQLA